MAGLAPPTIRQQPPAVIPTNDGQDVIVEMGDDAPDIADVDEKGAILRIEHGDGSLTVSLDGRPLDEARDDTPSGWFSNLAEKIDGLELSRIAEELLRGVDDDMASRKEWIESRALGIKLLGLQIEIPGLQGASDGAPVEGMSKVRHPLLLEACLRFQANARSELLPTDGPVKVRDDSNKSDPDEDELADVLEQDMNHYLTDVASEYYPDTDRMLFMLGFGGTAFKKVYRCPLRMRPVSETVDANDLIVNNSATDLKNAKRITHRTLMRPSTVKRMQILGVYRDLDLSTPVSPSLDSVQRQEKATEGVSTDSMNPEDRDREIYECYCELDIKGYEHRYKGKISGLEIPYRVTIDVSSKEILSVVRNYEKDTAQLPEPRSVFVKYTFVPGMGFLDIGLLNILGNPTNALTAAWREMLDNGMYANFPGFLLADTGARQNTNIFRVPPGGGALVKTAGMKISDAVMPMPYNTQHMPALMALVQDIAQTGMRIGGTSEQAVGEGRADAPVGTTLALIEQATKVLNSVHKRMHAAQAEEFKLLVDCFREDPEAFWRHKCASKTPWTEQMLLKALKDCELVPQADPNTASHMQRVMKVQALAMWAQMYPSLADPIAISRTAIAAMGWNNPEQFMAPPSAQAQPPPELLEIQAGIRTAQQIADAKTTEANAKMAQANAKIEEAKAKGLGAGAQQDTPVDQMMARAKMMDAQTNQQELGLKRQELGIEDQNRDQDRQAREHTELMKIVGDILTKPAQAAVGAREAGSIEKEVGA